MGLRIFDLLEKQASAFSNQTAFGRKIRGQWTLFSYEDYLNKSNEVARLAIHLGTQKGDKVITLLDNGPYWHFIDMGLLMNGAIHVSLNPNTSADDTQYIGELTEARFAFVSNKILYRRMVSLQASLPLLEKVIFVDPYQKESSFLKLVEAAKNVVNQAHVDARKEVVKGDDPASIFFTSGTTGRPKGAVYFHTKTTEAVHAFGDGLPIERSDKALSYLPLSHALERQYNYLYLKRGASVYYASGIASFAGNLQEIQPHVFVTTPLLLEELYKNLPDDGDLNNALGGQIKMILAAGAKFSPTIEKAYWDAGIKVFQMYGITECNLITKSNPSHGIKLTTVGKPVDRVQVMIDEETGEILVKSPYVIPGYFKNPEKTKETIDADGWFHSGDIGKLEDGFLTITGRLSEKFKVASGVYVSPVAIEKAIKQSPLVDNAMVFPQENKIAGLLTLNAEKCLAWADENGHPSEDLPTLLRTKAFHNQLMADANRNYNANAFEAERVQSLYVTSDTWSIEGGELTPTRKIRRKAIRAKFEEASDSYQMISLLPV